MYRWRVENGTRGGVKILTENGHSEDWITRSRICQKRQKRIKSGHNWPKNVGNDGFYRLLDISIGFSQKRQFVAVLEGAFSKNCSKLLISGISLRSAAAQPGPIPRAPTTGRPHVPHPMSRVPMAHPAHVLHAQQPPLGLKPMLAEQGCRRNTSRFAFSIFKINPGNAFSIFKINPGNAFSQNPCLETQFAPWFRPPSEPITQKWSINPGCKKPPGM